MKYFGIIIFFTLSICSVTKGLDRFAFRDNDAGIVYYFAAVSFGVAAIILSIQLFKENKNKTNNK